MKPSGATIAFSVLTGLLPAGPCVFGQDPHFAEVQDMNIWYNPALKTNMVPRAHINIRNVNYPTIIAYTSKAATIELPLIGRDKDPTDDIPFMNIAAGINVDNSKDGFMNVSTGMFCFSYALPLNGDDTYLAAGFQSAYTFSRVGLGGNYHFPDQFDKYGALFPAMEADPFQSGYSKEYFTAGVGAAFFHNGERRQWYIGGSIGHLNHPYTEWTHSVRLAGNQSIQAGYNVALTGEEAIGGYGNFSWHGSTRHQLIGILYSRKLDDSTSSAIFVGFGCRLGDALMPNLAIKVGGNQLAFYYEINISGTVPTIYNRKAFEFSLTINLWQYNCQLNSPVCSGFLLTCINLKCCNSG